MSLHESCLMKRKHLTGRLVASARALAGIGQAEFAAAAGLSVALYAAYGPSSPCLMIA
jgi:DNA-binding transcriptional regulator YiaG